jgi:hypothetical protein
MARGSLIAAAIAWAFRRYATLLGNWTAIRLSLGSSGNVSSGVHRFAFIKRSTLAKDLRD